MVDAVNNNNTAVYTGIGTVAGAAAGAGYGAWMSKPLLSGEAPSDAFVRRYYDNSSKATIAKAGEDAKKALTEDAAYKAAGDDVAKLKDVVKANAEKFGLKAEVDADGKETKSLDKVIEEFVGDKPEAAKLKEKMEKAVSDTASKSANEAAKDSKKLIALKKAVEGLKDDADEAARKAFVQENAEALGIKADDVESTSKKTVAELKKLAEDAGKPIADAKAKILEHFDVKEGMKKLADGADDNTKAAYEAVKKAARDTRLWAGAKWAAGVGAVLGVCSYIGAKMTAPKADEKAPETIAEK